MVNKNQITESNDILIKVDQNNLIYIDPNTVSSNGEIKQRQVEPENLVMFINLEADLIPRTTLISSDSQNTLISVADGMLSLTQNKDGRDYDTKWTDSFMEYTKKKSTDNTITNDFYQSDKTAQTFGIESIKIEIKGTNFIPKVDINFIDVRGKTLFESPENSPYKAFFHLPWPIFYLTVKGYYGKPIRYRLHLVSFSSKMNSDNGNFEISTSFVGSTYAYLTDIPLDGILSAPYMYGISVDEKVKWNEKTQTHDTKLSKSSRGYITLKSVYREYIQKGLLPKDFPVKTLREVAILARSLDKILENILFSKIVDYKTLAGIKEFSNSIRNFVDQLKAWRKRKLSVEILDNFDDNTYLKLRDDKTSTDIIDGQNVNGTLKLLIDNNVNLLNGNQAFGSGRVINKKDKYKLTPNTISFKSLENMEDFYVVRDGEVGVNFNEIMSRLEDIEKDFAEQAKKISKSVQDEMNIVIKDETLGGIGFEPTIRNIVGIVLANADTYIRLMKDVHSNAFKVSESRLDLIQGFSKESVGKSIYPWPEIKKEVDGEKNNVLSYPGALDLITKLKSNDRRLWPEVEFVEEFLRIMTKKVDNLGNDSNETNYVFETDTERLNKKDISTLTYLTDVIPYYDKTISSILYEIWERGKYITTVDSFNPNTIKELANIEYQNLVNQISEDYDLLSILGERIKSVSDLEDDMLGFAPIKRWPYLEDQLPTVPYLVDNIDYDYEISDYVRNKNSVMSDDSYPMLKENLTSYLTEDYRKNIYPFNSPTYLTYLKKSSFGKSELDLNNILNVNVKDGFITSPIEGKMWVKPDNITNLFTNKIQIDDLQKELLNTPYFHKQLHDDFYNQKIVGKYTASAYLFLNSLPFYDLDDTITYDGKEVLMSTMFREVGASHFIPYHQILRWGSIYHRYKKQILDGVDIVSDIIEPLNGDLFFDNFSGRTYDLYSGHTANREDKTNIGLNPYYHSVFHQVVNNYTFFDPQSGPPSYSTSIDNESTKVYGKPLLNGTAWTSFIDNSKFDVEDTRYTLLPSNGYIDYKDLINYSGAEQDNYRVIWRNDGIEEIGNFTGQTFPTYSQYFKDIDGTYTLTDNNKKVIDLIGTFKPDILDEFEKMFIDFSSQILNEEQQYNQFDVKYQNFQSLLKEIVSVKKETTDPIDINALIRKSQEKQVQNLKNITNEIISNDNLMKLTLSNPKELNNHFLGGYINYGVKNFPINSFDGVKNTDLIELYIGEDMDFHYQNFFVISNIEMSEENILNFRFLIQLYGGYVESGQENNRTAFSAYLKQEIIDKISNVNSGAQGQLERFKLYLLTLVGKFDFEELIKDNNREQLTIDIGFNEDPIKLELYNYFKSFNDKWVAGNSLGQKTLLEEFLFLDKANKDIGDEAFIDLRKLTWILEQPNKTKMSLFNVINLIIRNTGFDLRVLPAYVNFYGTNFSSRNRVTPSSTVAENLFGTFLDVDYENSSPKVLLQYVGQVSNHVDLSNISEKYKFKDDGVDISEPNNNPIIISPEIFRNTDFSKSNKVVAFEVSFGDQNQAIFKNLQLDQTSIKNTTESFQVLERLGNSQAGSSTSQIDIGLYDIYRQVSYACEVTAMGNAMIQPTMYFHLKNTPLFKGSYWITEVSHSISPGKFDTTFKGSRIPLKSLPNPRDSFSASYRTLFDGLISKAEIKVKEESLVTNQKTVVQTPEGQTGQVSQPDPEVKFDDTTKGGLGITPYGIGYNGGFNEENVKLIKDVDGQEWLRAKVVPMDSQKYPIDNATVMNIISRYNYSGINEEIIWEDMKLMVEHRNIRGLQSTFYSTNFQVHQTDINKVFDEYVVTEFYNKKKNIKFSIPRVFDYDKRQFSGPVNSTVLPEDYGIAMSDGLMDRLGLYKDEYIYFRLDEEKE